MNCLKKKRGGDRGLAFGFWYHVCVCLGFLGTFLLRGPRLASSTGLSFLIPGLCRSCIAIKVNMAKTPSKNGASFPPLFSSFRLSFFLAFSFFSQRSINKFHGTLGPCQSQWLGRQRERACAFALERPTAQCYERDKPSSITQF